MATWNMFSEEVAKERHTVRAYGLSHVANRCKHADSYKAQALRELAMRLELEELVKEKDKAINALTDKLEYYDQ